MRKLLNVLLIATAAIVSGCGAYGSKSLLSTDADLSKVQPTFSSISSVVFDNRCTSCHSGSNPSAGLDLTNHTSLLSQGVVKPGDPNGSLLIGKLRSGDMPQGGPSLPGDVIDVIAQWIQDGAKDD